MRSHWVSDKDVRNTWLPHQRNTRPGKGPRESCISADEDHATCAATHAFHIPNKRKASRFFYKAVANECLDWQLPMALWAWREGGTLGAIASSSKQLSF